MTSEPLRDAFDASGRGLQHHGLRKANERAVLMVIGFNAGVSNADIARLSGLAPQTVSAILVDLDRSGLITRGEVLRGRRGQPATPISLDPNGAFSIGIEIGWCHVDVLMINLHGQVLTRRHRTHEFPAPTTLVDDLVEMCQEVLETLPEDRRSRLTDIGVAMPTNLPQNLALAGAPKEQLDKWSDLDVGAELQRRTGIEVTLFNDGNAACWAELIAFPKPRPGDFIYFMLSRYLAAGIVGQGTLWEGPTGNSANLGSMLVSDGNGEMQSAHHIASVTALERRLADAGIVFDALDVAGWNWASFGQVLKQWLNDSARALALVVFNTTTVIETRLVVVDSILPADIVKQLVERLEVELQRLPSAHATYAPPQVLPGHLGGLAPAIGASELTLYRRYFSRTLADLAG